MFARKNFLLLCSPDSVKCSGIRYSFFASFATRASHSCSCCMLQQFSFNFIFTLLPGSSYYVRHFLLLGAMVDRTAYPDKDHTPEQAVRNIFGRQHAQADVCLLFSKFKLLSYARIAMLGKDEDAVRKSFTAIIGGEDKLGADASEIELNWLTVTAVWLACRNLVTAMSTRQAKMLDDPSIVPALPSEDHVDFRARFVQAHVDMVLVEAREPHQKFTERINRDLAVLGSIPF